MTLDKRTVALGLAAAAAVAAAATATAINHTSHGSKQRRAVGSYIDSVNAIQNQMHTPLARVMQAYRDFTGKRPTRNPAPELGAAARTLTRLDRRLAAIPAPPEARALRAKIVSLVEEQAAITQEVQRLATFTPRYASILRRSSAASTALGLALKSVQGPKPHTLRGTKKQILAAQARFKAESSAAAAAQADAVDAYDHALARVIRALRTLQPPQSMKPLYSAQVRSLEDTETAGSRLADRLRAQDRSTVPALSRRFTLASREAGSLAVQRAQIAAIRTYNKRARALTSAASGVQDELARLQRTLP